VVVIITIIIIVTTVVIVVIVIIVIVIIVIVIVVIIVIVIVIVIVIMIVSIIVVMFLRTAAHRRGRQVIWGSYSSGLVTCRCLSPGLHAWLIGHCLCMAWCLYSLLREGSPKK
jgi:hypothetical protein